jgi:muramoyltetrapeptide carboxypeptidase
MKDNTTAFNFPTDNTWGSDIRTIITDAAKRLNVPVAFGFPAGHLSDNRAFYLGRMTTLSTRNGNGCLSYQHV